MATKNFYDLLGDDENEDPSEVVVRANIILTEAKPAAGAVKKPTASSKKSILSAEAVKDYPRVLYDGARGGRGGVREGHGGRGPNGERDISREGEIHSERYCNTDRSAGQTRDVDSFVGARNMFVDKLLRTVNGEGRSYDGGRGGVRGRSRGGRSYCEGEDRPRRREFDRHSGNGRGYETEKRAGAGRGNWGTDVDPSVNLGTIAAFQDDEYAVAEGHSEFKFEAEVSAEATVQEGAAEAVKQEVEEVIEMTLEEYEKVLEEKRKALEAEKVSERKVDVDKAFEKMQLVDNKKREEDIFIKLGQDKEKVKRDAFEREEKPRKPVSINEFLKPAECEKFFVSPPNRGRGGRGGRGDRASSRGSFGGSRVVGHSDLVEGISAPKIEDKAQFPTLGGN